MVLCGENALSEERDGWIEIAVRTIEDFVVPRPRKVT